jgi:hypothetical protein
MNKSFVRVRASLIRFGACVVLVTPMAVAAPSVSKEKATQIAGVDNTAMGPYRALAQMSFQAFQKGDFATAAELSRVLERTWDAAEERGGSQSLGSRNKDLFEQIDQSMDGFIKPLLHYATKAPTADVIEPAYKTFLEELKKGDEQAK